MLTYDWTKNGGQVTSAISAHIFLIHFRFPDTANGNPDCWQSYAHEDVRTILTAAGMKLRKRFTLEILG